MGSGAITCVGNVDGRDVSADGMKLDAYSSNLAGIESGITADQSVADIRAPGFIDATNNGTGSSLDAGSLGEGTRPEAIADAGLVLHGPKPEELDLGAAQLPGDQRLDPRLLELEVQELQRLRDAPRAVVPPWLDVAARGLREWLSTTRAVDHWPIRRLRGTEPPPSAEQRGTASHSVEGLSPSLP